MAEMSERAERLKRAFRAWWNLPRPGADNCTKEAARIIVTELGITGEMVETVHDMTRNEHGSSGDEEYCAFGYAAADALSALLEVSNG